MALGVAFKAFFGALFKPDVSKRIQMALNDTPSNTMIAASNTAEKTPATAEKKPAPKTTEPSRSDALTLLSTLQREARLLDLINESLDGFEDAQIGAAAREVLKDCRKTLDRMFAIQPIAAEQEGATLQIQSAASPNRVRLVGKSTGTSGELVHRGWQATNCNVPKWNGQSQETLILSPIEIEVH